MSTGTHERAFKLFGRLFELLLEGQRHFETICATLQKLVYDQTEYPRYKNWPAICDLGRQDHLMMLVVATLDAVDTGERANRIRAAFPECFGPEMTEGPIPLSLIRAKAAEVGPRQGAASAMSAQDFPVSYEAYPASIPVTGFDKFGNSVANFEGPLLPDTIDPNAPQGTIVEWEGRQWVVLENNESCEELWIAPAERVAVDL